MYCQAIGGNIITASPISDLNPVFMAVGSKLSLMSKGKKKSFFCCCICSSRIKGSLDICMSC